MGNRSAEILRYVDLSEIPTGPDEFSEEERAALDKVNQKVAAAAALNEVMDFVFDSTRHIFPCDRIGLAFLDDDGQRVVAHWARALYEPLRLSKGYAEGFEHSSLKTVLERGAPRIIHDLDKYLEQHPESASTKLLVEEGVRSSLTCPLTVDGRVVGLLFRSSRKPYAYDEHQVRLHQAMAERLSQAVEKAYRIETLTAANQAYFEMLGFVTHELKSPLSAVIMNGQLLLNGLLGKLEPKQRDTVERMVRRADSLIDLIGEYLNLAQLESGQLEAKLTGKVDLFAEAVEPAIDTVQPALKEKGMTLIRNTPDPPLPIVADPQLLEIVLVNLLGNAVKYGAQGGQVRLTIERLGNRIRVSVWNEGPGFPENQSDRLFRKFSRLQTPELLKQKGTGVGLYTCWRIIQLHHGVIRARSALGKWAEFWFEIPQHPQETPRNVQENTP